MFTAKVYRVMVGSLSGAMEEVFAAKEIISKWNQEKAESAGKLYMPVEWSTKPEDMDKVDVVIGIVGNWIENPAFIEECIQSGKKVILFFQSYHDPKVSIPYEVQEVGEFKSRMRSKCHCCDYVSYGDLNGILSLRLSELGD